MKAATFALDFTSIVAILSFTIGGQAYQGGFLQRVHDGLIGKARGNGRGIHPRGQDAYTTFSPYGYRPPPTSTPVVSSSSSFLNYSSSSTASIGTTEGSITLSETTSTTGAYESSTMTLTTLSSSAPTLTSGTSSTSGLGSNSTTSPLSETGFSGSLGSSFTSFPVPSSPSTALSGSISYGLTTINGSCRLSHCAHHICGPGDIITSIISFIVIYPINHGFVSRSPVVVIVNTQQHYTSNANCISIQQFIVNIVSLTDTIDNRIGEQFFDLNSGSKHYHRTRLDECHGHTNCDRSRGFFQCFDYTYPNLSVVHAYILVASHNVDIDRINYLACCLLVTQFNSRADPDTVHGLILFTSVHSHKLVHFHGANSRKLHEHKPCKYHKYGGCYRV
ncbi:hypothetical protein DL546_002973 [Coniochaeta pulveracea]|uniref:Uncharacterized protein n=1 Tax=Coniochaeta pulveracea TaxID=177199 RepID=A0A420Y942_9PEZI|nr:hypothetical protein DL546_002973 [Coniochaeta pulveracea]